MEEKILKTLAVLLEKIDTLDKKIDNLGEKSKLSQKPDSRLADQNILAFVADLKRPRSKTWIARESGIRRAKHILARMLEECTLATNTYYYHTNAASVTVRSFEAVTLPGTSILEHNIESLRVAKRDNLSKAQLAQWPSDARDALAEDDKRRVDATRKALNNA